jgi:methyltransferase-like protein/2-polyprenyl-3-methyl-5-hydroxy-6-metoxy-1,4-benzoquinol methylase
MTTTALESYDEVLYPSYTHNQTHPDRLATLAMLFGMTPAPVENCRVLELGCGTGSNLIPMAFYLPESEFVGVDLAARPIATGQNQIETFGLKNIKLRQLNLMDVSPELGKFDYIIAHGLFSWVPAEVQDKILAICQEHLNPQGIAYVSYNAYPGGHVRKMVREMMLFHVRDLQEPLEQVGQALALIKFLSEGQIRNDRYSEFIKEEFEHVSKYEAAHIYHDSLARVNSPSYFYEFMNQAARYNLQFLAEADFFEMQYLNCPPQVAEVLSGIAAKSIILKEQYLDFLKCRLFRQTLLCHNDIEIKRTANSERLMNFYLASPVKPSAEKPDVRSTEVEEFRGGKGGVVATDHPLAKAAFLHLGRIYPEKLHFKELLAKARSLVDMEVEADDAVRNKETKVLAEILLQTYASNLLVTEVSERPVASPLARLQVQHGTTVTNMLHVNLEFEGVLLKRLLLALDGTRDRAALLRELSELVDSGQVELQKDEQTVTDPEKRLRILSDGLEENLARLAQSALLVS